MRLSEDFLYLGYPNLHLFFQIEHRFRLAVSNRPCIFWDYRVEDMLVIRKQSIVLVTVPGL